MPDANALDAYLGDGIHAQFLPVSGQLWLMVERANNPFAPPEDPRSLMHIERVCLERDVYEALVRFAGECWPDAGP